MSHSLHDLQAIVAVRNHLGFLINNARKRPDKKFNQIQEALDALFMEGVANLDLGVPESPAKPNGNIVKALPKDITIESGAVIFTPKDPLAPAEEPLPFKKAAKTAKNDLSSKSDEAEIAARVAKAKAELKKTNKNPTVKRSLSAE